MCQLPWCKFFDIYIYIYMDGFIDLWLNSEAEPEIPWNMRRKMYQNFWWKLFFTIFLWKLFFFKYWSDLPASPYDFFQRDTVGWCSSHPSVVWMLQQLTRKWVKRGHWVIGVGVCFGCSLSRRSDQLVHRISRISFAAKCIWWLESQRYSP